MLPPARDGGFQTNGGVKLDASQSAKLIDGLSDETNAWTTPQARLDRSSRCTFARSTVGGAPHSQPKPRSSAAVGGQCAARRARS